MLHIRTFPQPLTKHSCKTILCTCKSCHAIFLNNILYREIVCSRKGTSYVYALCECQSAVRSFCFHQHGFKNFHWFGVMSWRIREKYSQSWNAVLCNNRRVRSEQKQSSRSEQRKRYSSQKTYKVNFRCLITIWSTGIARRGFN